MLMDVIHIQWSFNCEQKPEHVKCISFPILCHRFIPCVADSNSALRCLTSSSERLAEKFIR